jgi:hypothetical protein
MPQAPDSTELVFSTLSVKLRVEDLGVPGSVKLFQDRFPPNGQEQPGTPFSTPHAFTLKPFDAKGHPFSKSCPPHASCFDPPEVSQVGFQRTGDRVCAQ